MEALNRFLALRLDARVHQTLSRRSWIKWTKSQSGLVQGWRYTYNFWRIVEILFDRKSWQYLLVRLSAPLPLLAAAGYAAVSDDLGLEYDGNVVMYWTAFASVVMVVGIWVGVLLVEGGQLRTTNCVLVYESQDNSHLPSESQQRSMVATERRLIEATVTQIRDELGAIQTDPLMAIELSSLFQSEVRASSAFWEAWISLLDNVELGTASTSQAHGVMAAWELARKTAELTRFGYMPPETRAMAETITKVLRRADPASNPNQFEAKAALEKAAELLAELNLVHFPPEKIRQAIGGRLLAIEANLEADASSA